MAASTEGTSVVLSSLPPRPATSRPGSDPGPGDDATRLGPQPDPTRVQPGPDRPAQHVHQQSGWSAAAPARSAAASGVDDRRGNVPGGLVGLVAAGVVAAGVFLPWVEIGSEGVSGWRASDDAKVLLGLAAVATVVAALLIGGARSLFLRLVVVGVGVASIGLGVFDMVSVSGLAEADTSFGLGLFLVVAGGTLLVASGAMAGLRRAAH